MRRWTQEVEFWKGVNMIEYIVCMYELLKEQVEIYFRS